jgi:hypothetical protein
MNLVEKAAPKLCRLNQNSKRQKKNEIAIDHRRLQRPLTIRQWRKWLASRSPGEIGLVTRMRNAEG